MSARRDAIFALALWQSQGTFPAESLTGVEDYGTALSLIGAVLRHKSSLEWRLKRCVKRLPTGELWAALMVGAAQLCVIPGIAPHAAIYETVEAVKPTGKAAAAFVNAALRTLQRTQAELDAALAAQPLHLQLDIPAKIWRRWVDNFGPSRTEQMAKALAQSAQVMIRTLRGPAPKGCTRHPEDPNHTFIVPRGCRVQEVEGFAEGNFVVQDIATAAAIEALDVAPGMRVLDACAAPGGKTAQIAARLFAEPSDQSLLVALEKSPQRMARLNDTLTRCKFDTRVSCLTIDASEYTSEHAFDRILLDVPCSNTGVFGRRPDARWTWDTTKQKALCQTQRQLLDHCATLLAPGGKLVYSTCSIEPEEDHAQVAAFLAGHPAFTCIHETLRLPDLRGDGAYCATLVRDAADHGSN